jgi:hypothetical protein
VPIGERLLNELVAAMVPPDGPVRELTVRPQAGNRLAVRVRASRLDFLPAVTVTLQIEQQPQPPDTPLVLRILSMPGLLGMAGALLSPGALPPGIRLDRDRVVVDLRPLLERHGAGDLMAYAERLHVSTDDGRLLVEVALRV